MTAVTFYHSQSTSILEYTSLLWNIITTTDANKLERIWRKFVSLYSKSFLSTYSLQLNLHT
jgi:hypothetical protein